MSKHTPGPWTVDRVEMPSGPLWTIHSEATPGLLADVWREPNARLIAAAPELLDALKECADRLHIHMKHTEDLVADMKAQKVIAKAEGE